MVIETRRVLKRTWRVYSLLINALDKHPVMNREQESGVWIEKIDLSRDSPLIEKCAS